MKSFTSQNKTMKKTSIIGLALLGLSTAQAANQVFPQPQKVELSDQSSRVKSVSQKLRSDKSRGGIWSQIPKQVGAYAINISPKKVSIYAHDKAGLFYARQTLIQLLEGVAGDVNLNANKDPYVGKSLEDIVAMGELPIGRIIDWSDIPYRGSVEGYYGQPWSHESRKAQLAFYGRNKMNTYIWAAKDDPYHHGYQCRTPYPKAAAAQISELCEVAKQNHVKFVWAIHPANTVDWSREGGKTDLDSICAKLELMYELGVRHYGLFVDDSSGEINKASRQAELASYITKNFIEKHSDVGNLIMCPTGYNRAWTNAEWLAELGSKLPESNHVMWTGNSVVHDIKLEGQQWVNKVLGRPAFIWWNWPCTDYCRAHLGMGRTYGLEQTPEMRDLMTGFVANPMERPEASKTGLFGVGDYSWNIMGYQSDKNWKEGMKRLYPQSHEAMQSFANNVSDLGVNFHGYRREESVYLEPLINKIGESLKSGKLDKEAVTEMYAQFKDMLEASEIIAKSPDAKLVYSEIAPWVSDFAAMAQAGIDVSNYNLSPQINNLVRLQQSWDQWTSQSKVKTGSLHLAPLIREMAELANNEAYSEISGVDVNVSRPVFSSNKGNSNNVENMMDNDPKSFWSQDGHQAVGDWYALNMGRPSVIKSIELIMGDPRAEDYIAKGQFEYSMDGKNWLPLGEPSTGPSIIRDLSESKQSVTAQYLRYRVLEARPNWLAICSFKINKSLPAKASTDVAGFEGIRAVRDKKYVGIARVMEVKSMKSGESISLELPSAVTPTWIEVNLENKDIAKWANLELTLADGSRIPARTYQQGNMLISKGDMLPTQQVKGMTLTNKSNQAQEIKMSMFKFDCPADDPSRSADSLTDGDLLSSYNCSEGASLSLEVPSTAKKATLSTRGIKGIVINGVKLKIESAIMSVPVRGKTLKIELPAQKDAKIYEVIFN